MIFINNVNEFEIKIFQIRKFLYYLINININIDINFLIIIKRINNRSINVLNIDTNEKIIIKILNDLFINFESNKIFNVIFEKN